MPARENRLMSLVHLPLTSTDPPSPAVAGTTVRAMTIGQHLMAVVLTAIGVIRAIGDGVGMPAAIISGIAILAWHTAGTILPSKTRSRSVAVWWLLGFAAIWIAAVAVSAEFVWLAFLLWLLAGHLLPLRWGLLFSGFVLAVVIVAPILHHGTTSYANIFGPLIGGIFAFGISRGYLQLLRDAAERERLVASLTRLQAETAELQDELALAQRHSGAIAERARISRTLAQVETRAGDSLADVRRIVAALAPVELDDDALASALQRMLDRVRDETGLQGELHVDDSMPILPTEVEVALLRTAQSALANVRLHARASRVIMSLIDANDTVRLDIIDDGTGFDQPAWEQDADAGSSYGLRFMRARLRELGGGLDLESTPGEGTALSIHLPIRPGPVSVTVADTTTEEMP